MADIAIFRINYKSDFILTLNSDAGWMTPFCIKFWTGAPSQAYFAGYDGTTYTHCAPVEGDPTKLVVQFDDHHLPIGDLTFQIGYHFTVADFPTSIEDEVLNQASVIIEVDNAPAQVMLDLNGETAPEIEFSLPAYANEAQRIANEEQRIAAEAIRIANEESRLAAETIRQQNEAQRISNEESRVTEFARLKQESETATADANAAATLANEKAALAADKAALAQAAATLANAKAQLAADKAALADAAATLANDKAALAQQKAAYAQAQGDYAQAQGDYAKAQGDYAKEQGDYAKEQGDTAQADHERAEADHTTAADDHTTAAADHTTAASDHTRAEGDHTTAASDHTRAEGDHTTAASDHTRAESDHTTAAADHETAASDHTRAESDHAAVEVYVDSLGAFDISSYHATGGELAKYADLTAALGNGAANIPEALRKGGMSVKFVQSSDNKYVQFRCIADEFTTDVTKWQEYYTDAIYGNQIVPIKYSGKYINIGAVGTTVNIDSPTNASQYKSYLATIDEGSYIVINGRGEWGIALYAILNSDFEVLERLEDNKDHLNVEFTAPENAAYLVINSKMSDFPNSYYSLSNSVEGKFKSIKFNDDTTKGLATLVIGDEELLPKLNTDGGSFMLKEDIAHVSKSGEFPHMSMYSPGGHVTSGHIINLKSGYSYKLTATAKSAVTSNTSITIYDKNATSVFGVQIPTGETTISGSFVCSADIQNGYYDVYITSSGGHSVEVDIQLQVLNTDVALNGNLIISNNVIGGDFAYNITLQAGGYFPVEVWQNRIRGKRVTNIAIYCLTKGSISIVKATGSTIASDTPISTIETFNANVGWNYYTLTESFILGEDEWLGVQSASNSARIAYDRTSSENNKYIRCYLGGYDQQYLNHNLLLKVYGKDDNYGVDKATNGRTERRSIVNSGLYNGEYRYIDHLFIDSIEQGQLPVIPSESLFNIEISHRLGFKYIEANIMTTSDNKFVVFHGTAAGAFGYMFEHVDGETDISSVLVNTVSLDWIKTNVRYKSKYAKYRVAPPTIEEWLYCVKKFNMIPCIRNSAVLDVANGIMGRDNYIILDPINKETYDISTITSTMGYTATKEAIVATCKANKAPFIYRCGSSLVNLTDAQIKEIIEAVHLENCLFNVTVGPGYHSYAQWIRIQKLGTDIATSIFAIENIKSGNLLNLCDDITYSDFATTGTVANGLLTLDIGDTITPNAEPETCFLSGSNLIIDFIGTVHVKMGNYIDDDFASDGSQPLLLSTYYLESKPTFEITGVTETQIRSIVFKASKF